MSSPLVVRDVLRHQATEVVRSPITVEGEQHDRHQMPQVQDRPVDVEHDAELVRRMTLPRAFVVFG